MKASEFEAIKAYCNANQVDINILSDGERVEVYRRDFSTEVSTYHELTKAVLAAKSFEEAGWLPV